MRAGQDFSHDPGQRGFGAVSDQLDRVGEPLPAGRETFELILGPKLVPVQVVGRVLALLFHPLPFMFELLDGFDDLAFALFPFRHRPGIGFGVKRVGGELSPLPLELTVERSKATVQVAPAGVDHGAIRLISLL